MSDEEGITSGLQSSSDSELERSSHTEASRERREIPTDGTFLSWNSIRVTARLLKAIAATWKLPIKASVDDMRLSIEGRLREEGKEPENVQLVMVQTEGGLNLGLVDQEGVFLYTEVSEESESESGVSDPSSGVGEHGETRDNHEYAELIAKIEQLEHQNQEAVEHIRKLEGERDALHGALEESDRVGCEQRGHVRSLNASWSELEKLLQSEKN